MTQIDSRLPSALEASLNHVREAVTVGVERVSQVMAAKASSATRIIERDLFLDASRDLNGQSGKFLSVFGETLTESVLREVAPRNAERSLNSLADWQSLSLVDDHEVEERMFADRFGQQISQASEWELREMASYMAALMGQPRADENRNPVRGSLIGAAIYKGIEAICKEPEVAKVLAREFALVMSQLLPDCYKKILADLKDRGIRPLGLSLKGPDVPSSRTSASHSPHPSVRDGYVSSSGISSGFESNSGTGLHTGRDHYVSRGSGHFRSGGAAGAANAQLMNLLRRLTAMASRPGVLDGVGVRRRPVDSNMGDIYSATAMDALSQTSAAAGTGHVAGYGDGLMAVNLIRAHRDELRQASTGALDHMVIEAVGSLFDQILSDNRVPPQMARQIARLQLPVLRVALADPSFFSSRKHPVRRFVNKMASLACAYDDFDDGPGKLFLGRVRELVQELVEGDFDQVDLYAAKMAELESFVDNLTRSDVQAHNSAATILESKESELRTQQRYMQQLQAALVPISMPAFLRDFLAQVWSQALVLTSRREGLNSEVARKMRLVGRDLVMSVQPKGSLPMRKKFLMHLPGLMKDLNDGLTLIGWPEDAQKDFFSQLLPAHSESLKQPAMSELDHNLLVKQLDAIFHAPIPGQDGVPRYEKVAAFSENEVEKRFTPEEAKSVGLVEESSVDWSGQVVDIDLGDEQTQPDQLDATPGPQLPLELGQGVEVNLDLATADPAEPTQGASLIDHIKVGFAYQMHLKDEWQKVRLSFVSPGRSFFVFTHGPRHQQTVSLTARMLSRMCESGRLRAVESTYLMERATARAREQLAALKSTPKSFLSKPAGSH